MKIPKVNPREIRITPTEKKFKKAREFAENMGFSALPKDVPLEKNVYIQTAADKFDMVKNKIQLSVEKMLSVK